MFSFTHFWGPFAHMINAWFHFILSSSLFSTLQSTYESKSCASTNDLNVKRLNFTKMQPKKNHEVLTWDSWDMWLRRWPNRQFWKPHISAVPRQNFMNFFLVTLLWQKSIWYFMVHVWAHHQFWENEHWKNHENHKMPKNATFLSL